MMTQNMNQEKKSNGLSRGLGLDLRALDWQEILTKLETLATCGPAKDRVRNLAPLPSAQAAQLSFTEIQEAQTVLAHGERPYMESLDLYVTWFSRLKKKGVLQTTELRDVRHFCMEAIALREVIASITTPWVLSIQARLMDAQRPLNDIDDVITPSGEIRIDASEALSNLHKEKHSQTRSLQNTLDRLVKQHDLEPVLQDRYVTNREGRWVLPVKSGMQHFFPGLIHASSQSKQTVFMEPEEVIPLNNRLRQIDVQIEEEIERLLTQLSHDLSAMQMQFSSSFEVMLEADVRLAQAKLAEILEANAVDFSTERLELKDVRHPLLVLQNQLVIPNSVKMGGDKRILLLSGPNAGGKTVLLKSVGLAAQMARCGLPICAEVGSSLPFFSTVLVAVGDSQSVDANLSTFAAHLKILNEATTLRGHDQLILFDEICGSTDPEEGSALARSFINSYAEHQVFGVITSHLSPLKTGWQANSGVINGSLEYSVESGQPTYQFFMGVPGQSLALQTARRVGVDEEIITRALSFLSPEAKAQHQYLREIEQMKEELMGLRKELHEELRVARDNKRKYLEMVNLFKRDREQFMDRTIKKAERKIDTMIDQANVDTIFKRHEKLQQIKHELPEVVKASTQTKSRPKLDTPEDFERVYPPGSRVFIPSIGQEGTIQGKANAKGEIPVLSNSMRLFVNWQQLKPSQSIQNPTSSIVRRTSGVQVTLQDTDRVIDVRGKTSEEAIEILEVLLDAASVNHEDRVKIVHGHGTETLKRSIRAHLSRSLYVKKWKAAGAETGGDGVTWAELKD